MAERLTERLRAAASAVWDAQHEHPFIRGIGDGSLDVERFKHWVRQDYLFLTDYARMLSLAAARAPDLDAMTRLAELAHETLATEMSLHRAYAEEFGISAAELERERPAPTCRAYTDFLVRTAATGAMFGHDGRYLYVAIRCALPEGDEPSWQADNDVPIDGIVPWGQDVVEILINPNNVLEGASGDIYALQVKPSGLVVASRGCRTDPPIGRIQPWRPQAELRIETTREAWTLELRLPLSSLGPRVLDNTVWGFNVTRLDASRGEYSSWSAARRHCYSPQSMGNLILVRP